LKGKKQGDEPIQVITHTYMEMSQWNSLYSYPKQKCDFSKTENREVKQVLSGDWYQRVGEVYVRG
jgi:hypothetical protein